MPRYLVERTFPNGLAIPVTDAGARRIPRGPRPATRGNPLGLTAREAEIAVLLARALTNARIGARLHISLKTVDHHVSAILGKLGVASREEAGRLALQLGLGPQDEATVAPKSGAAPARGG